MLQSESAVGGFEAHTHTGAIVSHSVRHLRPPARWTLTVDGWQVRRDRTPRFASSGKLPREPVEAGLTARAGVRTTGPT